MILPMKKFEEIDVYNMIEIIQVEVKASSGKLETLPTFHIY